MKTNGKTFIILGITFILCSAIWFLWVRNIAMGIVWLAIGILELCIAAILYWIGKARRISSKFEFFCSIIE